MDCLTRLDDNVLPPKEVFFSRLKNEGISEEDYVGCQVAWRYNGMTTLRDFLVWYNNRDVVPFLQFAFYQQRDIDMFKQGISVPGLTLLYLFNDLLEKTYFTLFNEKNKDLHHLDTNHVVGGSSLFFTAITRKGPPRYARKSTERPLVRVGRSSATMPTLCTCGLSCKTCRRDGTSDDGKRITSGLKRHRCTARWLQNGSHGKAKEQDSLFVIKSTVGGKGSVNFKWTGGVVQQIRSISSTDVFTTVTSAGV